MNGNIYSRILLNELGNRLFYFNHIQDGVYSHFAYKTKTAEQVQQVLFYKKNFDKHHI